MSVSNKKLSEGIHIVKYESKLQTLIGKIVCLFKGHKEVTLIDKKYCICCWKSLEDIG